MNNESTPRRNHLPVGADENRPKESYEELVLLRLSLEQCYELESAVSEHIRSGNRAIATGTFDAPILRALMRRRDLLEDVRLKIYQAI